MEARILRLSFSLLLGLLPLIAFAQDPVDDEEDSVVVTYKKPDSLKEKVYFRSVRFGTDILALILSSSKKYSAWEVNADADFGRFYLAADYGGWGKNDIIATGGDYANTGTYWRFGVDVNLLKKDPDRNMFFFGLRYARSSFSETMNVTTIDPNFGAVQYQLNNTAASAVWGELVTGIRVKVWKEFWMGLTSRMKFALSTKGDTSFPAFDVPGYGVVGKGLTWGFNYQIFWRIPFERQKKPTIVVLK
jgi:hypothetical protein